MILDRGSRLRLLVSVGCLLLKHHLLNHFLLRRLPPIHLLLLRRLVPILQTNTQLIHPPLHLPHIRAINLSPVQNLLGPPRLHPLDPLEPHHLRLPHPLGEYDLVLAPPPLQARLQRRLDIDPDDHRARVPHAGNHLFRDLGLGLALGLEVRVERRHPLRQPRREVDVLPPHRLEPAAPLDFLPGLRVRPVHDEARTVGVGQEDGVEDLLVREGRDGVALGGADAPACGVRGGRGARDGGGVAEGAVGVEFDLVALFVVGGDDGLELGKIDFQGDDASPGELYALVR